ncbi:hypothetical protein CsatB_010122 [Cannabis sativa]
MEGVIIFRCTQSHKEDELIQLKREAKLKGGARAKQYARELLNPVDEAEEEQVTQLKRKKKLPASPRPVEHASRIREPISPVRPSAPVFGKGKAVMSEIRSIHVSADARRSKEENGRSSSASPPAKKSKGREVSSSKEKRPSGEVIDLFEELTAANPSTPKAAKSKESGPPTVGSELVRSDPEWVRCWVLCPK